MSRPGKIKTCDCGGCKTCKQREAQARYWSKLSPEERAAKTMAKPSYDYRRDEATMVKRRVHSKVFRAIQRGDLVRGECAHADDTCSGSIVAHHDDYEKPYEVQWLCRAHHNRVEENV